MSSEEPGNTANLLVLRLVGDGTQRWRRIAILV
jgi:hypothetical protein